MLVDAGLDRFLAQVAADAREPLSDWISTDENLYLEYATPRGNVLPWSSRAALVAKLNPYREPTSIQRMLVESIRCTDLREQRSRSEAEPLFGCVRHAAAQTVPLRAGGRTAIHASNFSRWDRYIVRFN